MRHVLTRGTCLSRGAVFQVFEEGSSPYIQYNIEQAGLNTADGFSEYIPLAQTNVTANINDEWFLVSSGSMKFRDIIHNTRAFVLTWTLS